MMMENIEPRAYQLSILETAKKHNTLVVLPTGMGKTLVALMLSQHRLSLYPESKIVLLAPTRPLVEQHYNYFKKYADYEGMHLFTGKIAPKKRADIWQRARIIFSTPQCIENDLKHGLIGINDVSLVVEDEAHRCLKNYSYVYVAQEYLKHAKNARLLGLTASPGSDASVINHIAKNLGISAVEIRTRESLDVKPYLQKLDQEIIRVDLTDEMKSIRSMTMELYKRKVEELKNRQLLFAPPTKTNLILLQKKLQKNLAAGNIHFNVLRGISVCAQAIKLQHLLELVETQGVEIAHNYMKDLFEQARQGKSKAVKQLVNSKEINDAYSLLIQMHEKNIEHPKFQELRNIMLREIKNKPTTRAIVFSQYRDTVEKISNSIERLGIKSKIFIGQAKRRMQGLTQIEQQAIIREFKMGKINVLVATSIGEEGLDLPEVDLVIFYEPIPSAIRKIQRQGRTARLKPGRLVILIARNTRDESYYWAAYHKEKKMHAVLEDMQRDFKKKTQESGQKKIDSF